MKAILIFGLTYPFLLGFRPRWLPLGRVGGVVLGAFLAVALGVVPPEQAFSPGVIDWNTILLLLGMMTQASLLARAGFYRGLGKWLQRRPLPPWASVGAVMVISGLLSAILTNDAACVFLAPLLFEVRGALGLAPVPLIWSLIVGANVGSALTLSGNPQNAIIGSASGIHYLHFLAAQALPVTVGSAASYGVILLLFRGTMGSPSPVHARGPEPAKALLWRPLPGLVLTVAGYLLGYPLGGAAMAGALLSLILWPGDAAEVLRRVDWPLLILFAGLFIVMHGVETSPQVGRLGTLLQGLFRDNDLPSYLHLGWISLLGSQALSNVPFVLLARGWAAHFGGARLFWYLLGFVSTVSGCLTPVGSVVNLIVLEEARRRGIELGFWSFVRYGIPLTLAALLPGSLLFILLQR